MTDNADPDQFARHLAAFKRLLLPGKAISAWKLAYLLARQTPPTPTRDAPVTIPIEQRPPLVIAALRWISTMAKSNPVSSEDEARRERGWIEYFVRSEIALAMLEQVERHADPWRAMPHVRTLDAAVLLAGDQPQPGVFFLEDLTEAHAEMAQFIAQETGASLPSKWASPQDGSDWISAQQLTALLSSSKEPEKTRPTPTVHQSRQAPRMRAILRAIDQLSLDPLNLPPKDPKKRSGARAMIKAEAFAIDKAAFGPGGEDKAFNHAWDAMHDNNTLKYRPAKPT